MPDFNSLGLPQWEGTGIVPRTGAMIRYASNGDVRVRMRQSANKHDVQLEIGMMSQTQRDSLVAFCEANRASTFTFTAVEDNVQRTYIFAATPYRITPTNGLYKATVYMIEA